MLSRGLRDLRARLTPTRHGSLVAAGIGDVRIVAPDVEQSSMGHAITHSRPITARRTPIGAFDAWRVNGTPADCVLMAVRKVMPERPDLVLSGVNSGQNMADDVTYSGTVAGAMEGTLLGIRSIAISQAYNVKGAARLVSWETVETLAPELLERILKIVLQRF